MKWYAPATWFSHAPANAVDSAHEKETAAERAAVKLAQKATHETEIALGAATDSRPVTVARESTRTARGLLDQIAGPLTAAELGELRATIAGLLSDNAQIRAEAERNHARDTQTVAEISARLAKTQAASEAAEKGLRAAFERENNLANELRSARALHWILGGCAVLALAGWVYVRFFLGGIPGAVGSMLAKMEKSHPDLAGTPENPGPLRIALNSGANRHEQATIFNAYLKAR